MISEEAVQTEVTLPQIRSRSHVKVAQLETENGRLTMTMANLNHLYECSCRGWSVGRNIRFSVFFLTKSEENRPPV